MALINDGSRAFDHYGNPIMSSLDCLKQAERRVNQKKEMIEDMQNEFNLLEKSAYELYKNHVNYYRFDPWINGAKKWLEMLKSGKDIEGNKIDRRRNYKEKQCYDALNNGLKELLGIDLMIKEMNTFNFGEATFIYFSYNDHEWYVNIPTISGIRFDSYKRYGSACFKLRIVHKDDSILWKEVGATFVEEELKEIMEKGIEEYFNGDNIT